MKPRNSLGVAAIFCLASFLAGFIVASRLATGLATRVKEKDVALNQLYDETAFLRNKNFELIQRIRRFDGVASRSTNTDSMLTVAHTERRLRRRYSFKVARIQKPVHGRNPLAQENSGSASKRPGPQTAIELTRAPKNLTDGKSDKSPEMAGSIEFAKAIPWELNSDQGPAAEATPGKGAFQEMPPVQDLFKVEAYLKAHDLANWRMDRARERAIKRQRQSEEKSWRKMLEREISKD